MLPPLPWKKIRVPISGPDWLSKNQPFSRVPSAELNHTFSAPSGINCLWAAVMRSGRNVINDSSHLSPYTNPAHPRSSATAAAINRSRVKILRFARKRCSTSMVNTTWESTSQVPQDETRPPQMLRLIPHGNSGSVNRAHTVGIGVIRRNIGRAGLSWPPALRSAPTSSFAQFWWHYRPSEGVKNPTESGRPGRNP